MGNKRNEYVAAGSPVSFACLVGHVTSCFCTKLLDVFSPEVPTFLKPFIAFGLIRTTCTSLPMTRMLSLNGLSE